MAKLISIVVAVFNEGGHIKPLYEEICDAFSSLDAYDFELIFINDGSSDNTHHEIAQLAHEDKRVKLINLSRNFGNQIALSAGLEFAKGVAAITMDGDLQHPPRLIPEFISKWDDGYEIVIGERIENKDIPVFRKIATRAYFLLLKKISDINLESDVSDFRLLDRKVVETLKGFGERNRFLRGLIHWVGFNRAYVPFQVDSRRQGFTRFSLMKLIRLGMQGITGFSLLPLKLAGYLGFIITGVSLVLLIYMGFIVLFVNPALFRPIAFFAVLNSLLCGFILVCLGLMALYIGNTYSEVLRRPLYIVRETINIDEHSN